MTSGRCIVPKRDWNSASRTSRSSPSAPHMLLRRPEREKSDKTRERRNPSVWGFDTRVWSVIRRGS